MLAVETRGVSKVVGGRMLVERLDLSVPRGAVYALLGPNGAGKTTTMRMLLSLLRPDCGRILLLGRDLLASRTAALRGVGAFVETPALYEHLSGVDNLRLTARLLRQPSSEVDRVLDVVGMSGAASRRVGTYSLGMKQRLAIGRCLLGSPRLLLLDEPTNGLDPEGMADMRVLIRALPHSASTTVLMSSHLLAEVEQTASHVGVMRAGRLVLERSMSDLLRTTRLTVETSDPPGGAALLAGTGFEVLGTTTDAIRLSRPADAGRAYAETVIRRLVEGGFGVSAAYEEGRTLEDVYRSNDALEEVPGR
jgi:ABC-2 type transport system ATP-binding protein